MGRKRFTDADKWEDGWFCEQPCAVKLFWIYLCDRCDHAGVWEVNWRLAKFHLGEVEPKAIEAALVGRFLPLKGGKSWFIPGFIKFQYANILRSSVRPQLAVINLLIGHGVVPGEHGICVMEDGRPVHRNAISSNTRERVIAKCGNECAYCGVSGDYAELTMDHIIPISKGGDGKETNLIAACRSCNSAKSNKIQTTPKQYPSSCLTAKDKDVDKDKDSKGSAEGVRAAQRDAFGKLLVRLVVADGGAATRKWWALAQGNPLAKSFDQKCALVEWCVSQARGAGASVNYASDCIGWVKGWAP